MLKYKGFALLEKGENRLILFLFAIVIISILSIDGKLKKANEQNAKIIDLLKQLNEK